MKSKGNFRILFGVLLLSACACSGDRDDYCIKTESFGSSISHLTQPEKARAEHLFTINNIDYSRLQFLKLTDDSPHIHIRCYQYVNGLKVFTETLLYQFENSHAVGEPRGDIISAIDIGSEPTMDARTVLDVFISKIETDDPAILNNSDCFILEFGYYDLNAGTGKLEHDFINAWKVSIEGRLVPFGFVDDNKRTMIHYDNGARY